MAGGGGGLQAPQRQKRGKQSKRKKPNRLGFAVDMTPLVDITMLLLTFFMFTTTMMKPQIMEMRIPPEDINRGEDVKVKASELFFILVREDGQVFYQYGHANGEMTTPEKVKMDKLDEIATKQNLKPEIGKNRLVTVLKVDPKAKYDVVIAVLNELNLAEASIVTEMVKDTDPETGKPYERKRRFTFGKFTDEDKQSIEGL